MFSQIEEFTGPLKVNINRNCSDLHAVSERRMGGTIVDINHTEERRKKSRYKIEGPIGVTWPAEYDPPMFGEPAEFFYYRREDLELA